MTFKEDLTNWKLTEKQFAKMLIDKGAQSIELAPNEKFKDWDIKSVFLCNWVPKDITWEVKDDKISSETWNIGIEFRCFWKPSGIYASKADYIVYHLDNKFYYQNRWALLYNINNVQKTIKTGWDYDGSEMYVISKSYLDKLFKERWKTW